MKRFFLLFLMGSLLNGQAFAMPGGINTAIKEEAETSGCTSHITEQFVLQSVRFATDFPLKNKKAAHANAEKLKREICTVQEIKDGEGSGILFTNIRDPKAPLMVHFHGGENDSKFTVNKFSTLLYELLYNGFSVFCPHYDSDGSEEIRHGAISSAINSCLRQYSENTKAIYIDAFSSGVGIAIPFLRQNRNGEFDVRGAHFRVGKYGEYTIKYLPEIINYPLFVSIAGKDRMLGDPFPGLFLVRYLLDCDKDVMFYFMPTGSHHLIPEGLVSNGESFPEGDDDGNDYVRRKKGTLQYRELYDYVDYKNRVWRYFKDGYQDGRGSDPGDNICPRVFDPHTKRRLREEFSRYYSKGDSNPTESVQWAKQFCAQKVVEKREKDSFESPSDTYNHFFERKDGKKIIQFKDLEDATGSIPESLEDAATHSLSRQMRPLVDRVLASEKEVMNEEPDSVVAYHFVSGPVSVLYMMISLFEQLKSGVIGDSAVTNLRASPYSFPPKTTAELVQEAIERRNDASQKAFKLPLNYQDGFNKRVISATPWLFGGHARGEDFPLKFMNGGRLGEDPDISNELFIFFVSQGIAPDPSRVARYVILAQTAPAVINQIFMNPDFFDEHGYLCEMWGEPIKHLASHPSGFLQRFRQNPEAAEQEMQEHKNDFCNPRGDSDFGEHGLIPELQMRINVASDTFSKNVRIRSHPKNEKAFKRTLESLLFFLREDLGHSENLNPVYDLISDTFVGDLDRIKENLDRLRWYPRDQLIENKIGSRTLFEVALENSSEDVVEHFWKTHSNPLHLARSSEEAILEQILRRDRAKLLRYMLKIRPEVINAQRFVQYVETKRYNCVQLLIDSPEWDMGDFQVCDATTEEEMPPETTLGIGQDFELPASLRGLKIVFPHREKEVNLPDYSSDMKGENKERLLHHKRHYALYMLDKVKEAIDRISHEGTRRWVAAYFYTKWLISEGDEILKAKYEAFKEPYGLRFTTHCQ